MRRKNITSEMMKNYMTESLLLLMERKNYADITVGEITTKAGVNRSTYYRHFESKEDMIKYFFVWILDSYLATVQEGIDTKSYLTGMFRAFLTRKRQIMTIYKSNLAYVFFDTLNSYFTERFGQKTGADSFDAQFSLYYHTGGIFNAFILWFSNDMEPSPEKLAAMAVTIMTQESKPVLL